ncbi:MAG: aminoacyl-tRNA hydrolase [Pseudomonadota bacterium]
MTSLKLIVGLGNPGLQYERTRHNVGARCVTQLASRYGVGMTADVKFKGLVGRGNVEGVDLRLLLPTTYMNLSGESVAALARFFKIEVAEILVAYDEMAFEPGVVRLKQGGGDNGHNGIKSIRGSLANNGNFHRLRIGVGHPGDKNRVTGYLTQVKMPVQETEIIDRATDFPAALLKQVVGGEWQAAMNTLHAGAS